MRAHLPERPLVVVEDSDEDFEVLVWALRKAGLPNPVHRCKEADDIATLLAGRSNWPDALCGAYPLVVLLDLNFPGADWPETLRSLRDSPWWRSVPVVIVSTSSHPATVSTCYAMGAAGYLQKTLDPLAFAATVRRFAAYWLEAVVPPPPPERGSLGALPAMSVIPACPLPNRDAQDGSVAVAGRFPAATAAARQGSAIPSFGHRASIAAAAARQTSSRKRPATICTPAGMPPASSPVHRVSEGRPVTGSAIIGICAVQTRR
ncbi:response regulator [Rhodovastum atsumiense]|uniref:Response regulator n=1 Tax=Rhodovastum atsumiense TaxID=504468 RepID=A0A5M6IPW6_9PROT|nr:response regulator [Rhodovastum atsumiense]